MTALTTEHTPLQVTLSSPPSQVKDKKATRRVAFDIGGGSIRMLVADVSKETNKVINKIFCAKSELKLNHHLEAQEKNKQFSPEIQKALIDTLLKLKEEAMKYHPDTYMATAASAFRKADNSLEVCQKAYKETKIPIQIITGTEEGELGFFSSLGSATCQRSELITIDIGTGSFQISSAQENGYDVYTGCLGTVDVEKTIRYQIRKQLKESDTPLNPITEEEAQEVVAHIINKNPPAPEWLVKKLQSPSTQVIVTCSNALDTSTWSIDTAWDQIKKALLNHNDSELTWPKATRRGLLCWAIMKGFKIQKMKVTGVDALEGNTTGLLTSNKYWKEL